VEYPFITFEENEIDTYFRPDLNDHYWGPHLLPEEWILRLYKN
jgi:hypothetical protein